MTIYWHDVPRKKAKIRLMCEIKSLNNSTHPSFSAAVGNHSKKHMKWRLAHGHIYLPSCLPLPRRWMCNKLDCLLCIEASEYLWVDGKIYFSSFSRNGIIFFNIFRSKVRCKSSHRLKKGFCKEKNKRKPVNTQRFQNSSVLKLHSKFAQVRCSPNPKSSSPNILKLFASHSSKV